MNRDLDKEPYSPAEARIAAYFAERGIGGGDDPVGFILSSYEFVIAQRQSLREALKLTRLDMQQAIGEIERELSSQTVMEP